MNGWGLIMARARNIKPGFFINDDLGDIEPLGRLLFVGMWTIADYKGDFEWREKRVKAQLLPYDNCDITKLAINLDQSGFIRFYSVQDKLYCRVVNFCTHQNPHKNERDKGSEIPAFNEKTRQAIDFNTLTINLDQSRLKRNDSASDPADSLNLIPDSFTPKPETGNLIPDTLDAYDAMNQKQNLVSEETDVCLSPFERFWDAYGKKEKRKACEKKWKSKKLDSMIDRILADIANRDENHWKWRIENGLRKYKPGPEPYLNGELWNDDIEHYDKTQNFMFTNREKNLQDGFDDLRNHYAKKENPIEGEIDDPGER